MKFLWTWFLIFLLPVACFREKPVRVENRNLGIVALFPGAPRLHRFTELTPFGEMEWFSTSTETPGRFDRSFYINVGNLPRGDAGGTTEPQILGTMRKWVNFKLSQVDFQDLPQARGTGFQYKVHAASGTYIEGIVILRRGRIHQAEATVSSPEDPQLKIFLDSFEVLP